MKDEQFDELIESVEEMVQSQLDKQAHVLIALLRRFDVRTALKNVVREAINENERDKGRP